jgi:type II secretory pathway pseudopilin PulG
MYQRCKQWGDGWRCVASARPITPFPHPPINAGRRECTARRKPAVRSCRWGLTLLELLIALSVMVMIVGTLGGLARAVQSGAEYSEAHAVATQHARVALERITRNVEEAFANERFPGILVIAEQVGPWRFPDTLVVWHPDASVLAAHPERLPLDDSNRLPYHDELIVYCPAPDQPNYLVEIRSSRSVPLSDNPAGWPAEIQVFKDEMSLDTGVFSGELAASGYPAVTLTPFVRACPVTDSAGAAQRAAVRFESRLRPSDEEWNDSSLPWEELSWMQGIYGSKTGMRQAWLRIELQLLPGDTADSRGQAIPFFGSAAVCYPMHRERRP